MSTPNRKNASTATSWLTFLVGSTSHVKIWELKVNAGCFVFFNHLSVGVDWQSTFCTPLFNVFNYPKLMPISELDFDPLHCEVVHVVGIVTWLQFVYAIFFTSVDATTNCCISHWDHYELFYAKQLPITKPPSKDFCTLHKKVTD